MIIYDAEDFFSSAQFDRDIPFGINHMDYQLYKNNGVDVDQLMKKYNIIEIPFQGFV
ncbi:hypothetical protein ACSVDA_06540 [Cytobacillus sp. Hm23]